MTAKILVVEDEPILALDMETALRQAGFEITGLASSCDRALALLERSKPDAAVLDANLRGASVEPVAGALVRQGVPFLIVSGYGRAHLPSVLLAAPFLPKPFEPISLVSAVVTLLT
jgi:DNA-binding response OmpR family regulator